VALRMWLGALREGVRVKVDKTLKERKAGERGKKKKHNIKEVFWE